MRVVGWAGVLCALLLVAGATEGHEKGSPGKDLSVSSSAAFLKRFTRSFCSKEITVTPSEEELYWRVGEVQDLWCSVVQAGDSSSTSDNLIILKDAVPHPHQTVNETTIQATFNLTEPESYKLICRDDYKDQMCMTQVYVGYEPLEVEDLQCVSHNWESFSCNWTLPYNPVQVAKNDYLPYLVSLDDPSTMSQCTCSDYRNLLGDSCTCPETCCLWTGTAYFPVSPQVVVVFVAENDLGSAIFNYTIDNYAVVLPNPMNVTVAAVAGRVEALVGWTLPAPMGTFAEDAAGVVVRVDHRLTDDGEGRKGEWIQGELVQCHGETCKTGQQVVPLEHWWRRYEVRGRLRSAAAPQPVEEDGWWSEWLPCYVNTSAAAPDTPPGMGPGTFQVAGRGFAGLSDLTLAWQTLPTLLHNGPDFGYLAQLCGCSGDDDDGLSSYVVEEVAVTDNFVVFQNVTSSASYTLRVSATNSEGGGPWATVRVAEAAARPALPLLPVVVQHAGVEQQGALYELRWAPEGGGTYTVYLCTGEQEGAQPCTGQLYWASAGNASAANLTLRDFGLQDAEPLQVSFAVSAEDAAGASSGLSWDRCGAPEPYRNVRGPPEPDEPITSSSGVELPWTLSCSYWADVVEEAEATCCRGAHASPDNCTEERVAATGQPWTGVVTVAGLEDGVEYTAWLRLHYRGGASLWADGQTFTTNPASVEVWLIVVVGVVGVLATVIIVCGLVYSKRKFVDNLKKLRLQPSLPSGLVPVGRQQDPPGSLKGVGEGGEGGGGGAVPVSTVSGSVKNPADAHILPTVSVRRPSLSLKDQEVGGDMPFGRGVTQGGRLIYQQQQQQQTRRSDADDSLINTNTERSTPVHKKGTVVSSKSSECLVSPSTSEPLLQKLCTSHYVSPYFSESESEGRDTYTTNPLIPGGYVGLSGPGNSGGGREERGGGGGSQSPPTETWSRGKSSSSGSSGGNSGYVSPSECTKLPWMAESSVSSGYVTAQHGDYIAAGSPGYVQADGIPHPLVIPEGGDGSENPGESGWYVSADFPMVMTGQAPPGLQDTTDTTYDPVTTSTDALASSHDSEGSIPPTVSLKGDVNGGEEQKQIEKPSYVTLPDSHFNMEWMGGKHTASRGDNFPMMTGQTPPGSQDTTNTTNDPVTTSTDSPASSRNPKDSIPPTASLRGDVNGGEEQQQIENPRYVSLPDAQFNMAWMGRNHTTPSDDKLDIKGSEGHEKPPRPASDAPAPGYIAVQPPDFGKPVQKEDTEGKTGDKGTVHYHDPDFLSMLLSKPGHDLQGSPGYLVSPVLPVSTPDANGVPGEAHKPNIPRWAGSTSVDGYVPVSVAAADDTGEKGNSNIGGNSWFRSLVSPPKASMASEAPLTGISFVMLDNIPSRASSVSGGTEIKETNVDSGSVEASERVADGGAENERAENENIPMNGLPQGYSRVGEPHE